MATDDRKARPMPRDTRQEHLLSHMTLHARAHTTQLLREAGAALTITSTRRTALRNRAVGGAKNSYHLQGRAVDLIGTQFALHRAADLAWLLRVGPGCTGPEEVLLEGLGTPRQHLHVAW